MQAFSTTPVTPTPSSGVHREAAARPAAGEARYPARPSRSSGLPRRAARRQSAAWRRVRPSRWSTGSTTRRPCGRRSTGSSGERGLAGVVFCGGEEKLGRGRSRTTTAGPWRPTRRPRCASWLGRGAGSRGGPGRRAALPPPPAAARGRWRCSRVGLALRGARARRLEPPRYERGGHAGPKLAVIGTGKRTGKTAAGRALGHAAARARGDPVIVCMGRGGPAEPRLAEPRARPGGPDRDRASAASTPPPTTSRTRCSPACARSAAAAWAAGSPAQPAESNVVAGAALAASLDPGAILFEGSGACIPPVAVDRTVCVVGAGAAEPFAEYRLVRADLVLPRGRERARGRSALQLRPEPAEPRAGRRARGAVHHRRADRCEGVEPLVVSTNLGRRAALAGDLERAAAEGCDLYLTELKAAAIDTVAAAGGGERRPRGVRAQPARRASTTSISTRSARMVRWLRRSSSTRATGCPTPRA